MSPHTEGKTGNRHTDIVYIQCKKGKGREEGTTQKLCSNTRNPRAPTQGIHVHVDNRRPLTAQAYKCRLQASTGPDARTNNAKCKGAQPPATCTGANASQNTVQHKGTLVNIQIIVMHICECI